MIISTVFLIVGRKKRRRSRKKKQPEIRAEEVNVETVYVTPSSPPTPDEIPLNRNNTHVYISSMISKAITTLNRIHMYRLRRTIRRCMKKVGREALSGGAQDFGDFMTQSGILKITEKKKKKSEFERLKDSLSVLEEIEHKKRSSNVLFTNYNVDRLFGKTSPDAKRNEFVPLVKLTRVEIKEENFDSNSNLRLTPKKRPYVENKEAVIPLISLEDENENEESILKTDFGPEKEKASRKPVKDQLGVKKVLKFTTHKTIRKRKRRTERERLQDNLSVLERVVKPRN